MALVTLLLHPFTLSLFFIVFVFLLRDLTNRVWSMKHNLPPSPPTLPIIGNLHQLGTLLHRSLAELSKQYGPMMLLQLGRKPTLVVSSAEMAREIMKTNDLTFATRTPTPAAKLASYGCIDIAFAPYGANWRHARKICMTELLGVKSVQSFKYIREEEVAHMIQEISRSSAVRAPINLTEILFTLNNDIVSRCSLGRKHHGKHKFGELASELLHLLTAFSFGYFFPWLEWVDVLTGLVGKTKKVIAQLDTYYDEIIDEHVLQMKKGNSDDKKDFVDLLLHVQQNNTCDIKFTRDNIKAIIMDMYVAGTDTASATIEWAICELIMNPSAMKKAQEEVRRTVGKKSKVDEEDLDKMEYLNCVVNEALRLHPPLCVPPPRECRKSINLKGYHLAYKTMVLINVWAIQRDPKVWHNPEEFIPERFCNNSIDFKGLDFDFIPFGSGRRSCPGMVFGIAVIRLAIANLLYFFDWEMPGGSTAPKELDMTEASGTTIHKKYATHLIPVSYNTEELNMLDKPIQ